MRSKELKRSILKILGAGESYGYEVHRKLMREGVRIEISRLYRTLNEMLKENCEVVWLVIRVDPLNWLQVL